MSDYNRQFTFDVAQAAYPVKVKRTLRQKLAAKTTFLTGTAALAVGAIVGGGVGAGVGITAFNYFSQPAPVVVNNTSQVNWVTAAASVASPSVVTISVAGADGGGTGSGVFLTEDGYILTNTHVVTLDGATADPTIEVKTWDGHVLDAKIIGTDPTNDLAVIKVESPLTFTPIQFADSSALNVGEQVVALGAPLGLENTVTEGIVSALNRTIQVASAAAPDSSGGSLQLFNGSGNATNLRVIQTDAAINPGNSGGALVNEKGQLVGINVAIATAGSATGSSGSIGVGFAIPSNVAHRIATEIMATGKASHALLGASVGDAAASKAAGSFTVGAEVMALTDGGAAQVAGIQVGDIIIGFNGVDINSAKELTAAVRQEAAGAEAEVVFIRDSKEQTVNVVLGDATELK
ncbi:trypsin-like peptidase domain-containing protein [Rhodoluna sp.]|uniref:S1C family serine protease n=1 Tax=Rhodoluna sp. TaxID=1969481 RepID=UPI0025EB4ABE|nr:trypsin-like peptidase domain-containing protein [Rhodoluna sp.]